MPEQRAGEPKRLAACAWLVEIGLQLHPDLVERRQFAVGARDQLLAQALVRSFPGILASDPCSVVRPLHAAEIGRLGLLEGAVRPFQVEAG